LAALVGRQWGITGAERAPYPAGAALLPQHPGGPAHILIGAPGADVRALGGALAWARSRGAGELHLLVESTPEVAGALARRAAAFAIPVTAWRLAGSTLHQTAPAAFARPAPLPPDAAHFADILRAVGADPVVEFGVLTGEVLGLEVARLVGGHLEVGVGQHDRQAHQMLFPERPTTDGLVEVVDAVRRMRTAGAQPHMANTLGAERWLRAVLVAHPELVGAAHLAPVPPPVPRTTIAVAVPAPAAGVDRDDRPLLVACSTGIDLDLVPAAADARLADSRPGCRLVLALPEGDDHPRTRQLAAALVDPAVIVTVARDWKALSTG